MGHDLDAELLAAIDELLTAAPVIPYLENEDITVNRLSVRTGYGAYKCKRLIQEWVTAGKIAPIGKRRESTRGQVVEAWRKA